MKLSEIVNWKSLPKITLADYKNLEETYPIENPTPILDKDSLFGIEIEVENIKEEYHLRKEIWNATEDGSLRNNGVEYISIPLKVKQIETALYSLFSNLPKGREFSKRTSIHVHMNVRTMHLEEIKSLCLIYTIFENALFKFVGQDRNKNIHCVPIRETNFLEKMPFFGNKTMFHMEWMKYTAFNLCPVLEKTKGTIEFRHMHGTDDIEKILNWINLLLCMKIYVYKNSYETIENKISTLNTNSQYRQFTKEVFGDYTHLLIDEATYGEFEEELAEGITLAKLYFSTNSFLQELKDSTVKYQPLILDNMTTQSLFSTLLGNAVVPSYQEF